MKECWICGSTNLSDEHKIKSSDLRRNYGKKYKDGKNELIYFCGNSEGQELINYKDDKLKFLNCICTECNNNVTKPHDNAYDKFIKYVSSNYYEIVSNMKINFKEIYRDEYSLEKRNLYKYFAKHAGCKIVTGGIPYDVSDLREFILNDLDSKKFMLHFQIKEGIKIIMDNHSEYYHLYNGPTTYIQLVNDFGFCGWQSYHWFTTNWFYSSELNPIKCLSNEESQKVELKLLTEYVSNEDETNIHLIEYCGIETVSKIRTNFIEKTK